MKTSLRTTTAVLACLHLVIPAPIMAQQGQPDAAAEAADACADPGAENCLDATERALEEGVADTADAPMETVPSDNAPVDGEAAPMTETQAGEPPAGQAQSEPPANAAPAGNGGASEAPAAAPGANGNGAGNGASAPASEPAIPDAAASGAASSGDHAAGGADAQAPASDPVIPAPDAGAGQQGQGGGAEAQGQGGGAGAQGQGGGAGAQGQGGGAGTQGQGGGAGAQGQGGAGSQGQAGGGQGGGGGAQGQGGGAQAPASEPAMPDADAPAQSGNAAGSGGASGQGASSDTTAPDAAPPTRNRAEGNLDTSRQAPAQGGNAANSNGSPGQGGSQNAAGGEAAQGASDTPAQGDRAPRAAQSGENAPAPRNQAGSGQATQGNGNRPPARANGAPARQAGQGGGGGNQAANQTANSAAAIREDATPSEETRQAITEDNARSSDEDFESTIQRGDGSETASSDTENDDGGLSDLEKALLLGAGALAVGTLLNGDRRVVASSDDRAVVTGADGSYQLLKNDNTLLQRPGTEVGTETFDDGSTRTTVYRQDGSRIETIRDASLRVLRRERIAADGTRTLLIDDTAQTQPVDVTTLRQPAATIEGTGDLAALRQALEMQENFDRAYSLDQVRNVVEVRDQVPAIELDNITFASGSAAISPSEAEELTALGQLLRDRIAADDREVFLVEGHTDAVGDAAYNLALSDRRAESVALALTEYFDVPPENLVVQGYGEQFLKIDTQQDERQNRRATVRRITPLLQVASSQ
ncbi:outer membrane protein OmpA-like peptidoglycan-associated protein [Palleronia aestuarii]|uniref:Outer membrane protein OmpA-like peptidoglycan-associated protein n=1 Tax=Palleronia aestuarii TaxID=568105 RepID=A0A2W7ND62_9RHOB|nr:OmpA family protein [Palleronia aestuarii]PZX18331.1 outer membrane protein OmpA-like peptidoglycan-associated protein [Palleronia aestuarii]